MGTSNSRIAANVKTPNEIISDPSAGEADSTRAYLNPSTQIDLAAPPRALVIGANLAGVHAAYELAARGFLVDVVEMMPAAGCGNAPFVYPVVGDRIDPFIFSRVSAGGLPRAIRLSFLGPSPTSSSFLSTSSSSSNGSKNASSECLLRIDSISTLRKWSGPLWRWFSVRRSLVCDTDTVDHFAFGMSLDSVGIIRGICKKHPTLARFVGVEDEKSLSVGRISNGSHNIFEGLLSFPPPSNGSGADDASTGAAVEVSPIPHTPARLLMDPVRWTQHLAAALQKEGRVRFHFNTIVNRVWWNMLDTDVVITGIDTVKKNGTQTISDKNNTGAGEENGNKSTRQRFMGDVFVFACGVSSVPLLEEALATNIPLLPVTMTAVTLSNQQSSHHQRRENSTSRVMEKMGFTSKANDEVGDVDTSSSSSSSSSVSAPRTVESSSNSIARRPVAAMKFSSTTRAHVSVRDVDVGEKKDEKNKAVNATTVLVGDMRVGSETFCGHATESTHQSDASAAIQQFSRDVPDLIDADLAKTKDGVPRAHTYSFSTVLTPDGLPIVSQLGPVANGFLMTGFGGFSPALAPSAAAGLAEMIAHPNNLHFQHQLSLARYLPRNVRLQRLPPVSSPSERLAHGGEDKGLYTKATKVLTDNISMPILNGFQQFGTGIATSPSTPTALRELAQYHFLPVTSKDYSGFKITEDTEMMPVSKDSVLHKLRKSSS